MRTLSPWSRHSWGFAGSTGCSWRPGWQDEAATPRPGSEDSSRGETRAWAGSKLHVTRRAETTPERLGLMSPTRRWETGRSQQRPDLGSSFLNLTFPAVACSKADSPSAGLGEGLRARGSNHPPDEASAASKVHVRNIRGLDTLLMPRPRPAGQARTLRAWRGRWWGGTRPGLSCSKPLR